MMNKAITLTLGEKPRVFKENKYIKYKSAA
jgi:hypothetical protein